MYPAAASETAEEAEVVTALVAESTDQREVTRLETLLELCALFFRQSPGGDRGVPL